MGSSPGLRESLLKLEEKAFQLVVDVRSMQVEFQAPEPGQESLNETSFLDVLHATPSLARACIACMGALPPVDQPFACGAEAGPGNNDPGCLRIMRLVCKSAGQAAMKAIGHWKLSFGSTFWADSSSLGMHEMDRLVQLLSSCNLKLLNVCLGASDLDMTSVGTEAGEFSLATKTASGPLQDLAEGLDIVLQQPSLNHHEVSCERNTSHPHDHKGLHKW